MWESAQCMSQRYTPTPNVLAERLTCVLPSVLIRLVRDVRRRLRLFDEMSDSFLKMSVDVSQQLHMMEGWYWKSMQTMLSENICSDAYAPAEVTVKGTPLFWLLSCKGNNIALTSWTRWDKSPRNSKESNTY